MNLLLATMMVPVFVSGLSLGSGVVNASASTERRMSLAPNRPPAPVVQSNFVYERRQRVQHVLIALDRIAAVTMQMKPETASRLEPVVVDLAEQAVDLSSDEALQSQTTDVTLTKLEATVTRLVETMNRLVEPEISL